MQSAIQKEYTLLSAQEWAIRELEARIKQIKLDIAQHNLKLVGIQHRLRESMEDLQYSSEADIKSLTTIIAGLREGITSVNVFLQESSFHLKQYEWELKEMLKQRDLQKQIFENLKRVSRQFQ